MMSIARENANQAPATGPPAGDERTGDVIRWAGGPKGEHFANGFFTGDDGITEVFSRSGISGKFEIVPENNPGVKQAYGPITGEFRPNE